MGVNATKSSAYRFGSYEFDADTGELRKQGLRVRLEGQPVAILALLLERPNQLVTREELRKALWPGNTFVDFEQSLNAAVRRLRLALDDSADSPRYIETLARKGYRWVAPVMGPPAAVVGIEEPPIAGTGTRRRRIQIVTRALLAGAIILAVAVFAWTVLKSRASASRVMLAVLPFQDLNGDTQQGYFADGMTEEMITQLGSLNPQRLGVIAPTSAMQYKGAHKDTGQIARELNVNYLLEGTVRREGQSLRVTAHLIQASDQADLWADSYDSSIGDVLKVQSDLARAIVGQIRLKLTPGAEQRLSKTPHVNALAQCIFAGTASLEPP